MGLQHDPCQAGALASALDRAGIERRAYRELLPGEQAHPPEGTAEVAPAVDTRRFAPPPLGMAGIRVEVSRSTGLSARSQPDSARRKSAALSSLGATMLQLQRDQERSAGVRADIEAHEHALARRSQYAIEELTAMRPAGAQVASPFRGPAQPSFRSDRRTFQEAAADRKSVLELPCPLDEAATRDNSGSERDCDEHTPPLWARAECFSEAPAAGHVKMTEPKTVSDVYYNYLRESEGLTLPLWVLFCRRQQLVCGARDDGRQVFEKFAVATAGGPRLELEGFHRAVAEVGRRLGLRDAEMTAHVLRNEDRVAEERRHEPQDAEPRLQSHRRSSPCRASVNLKYNYDSAKRGSRFTITQA